MHVLTRKSLSLIGLFITTVPTVLAQKPLAFGLQQSDLTLSKAAIGTENETANFKGPYSFSLQGSVAGQNISSPNVGVVGSIIADGKGRITSGEEDYVSLNGTFAQLPVTGSYSLNANGFGTLTLVSSKMTQTFSLFVPQVPGQVQNASLVETDDLAGVSGSLNKQVAQTALNGNYSFSLSGNGFSKGSVVINGTTITSSDPVAVAGTMVVSGESATGTASIFIGSAAGSGVSFVLQNVPFPAVVTAPDANGRFTFTAAFSQGGPQEHFAGYIVDATHFNLLSIDPPTDTLPLLNGTAVQ
jgi:hypothetical protein